MRDMEDGLSDEKRLKDAIHSIYTVNLRVKPEEKVLVFTDYPNRDEKMRKADGLRRKTLLRIAKLTAQVGRELCKTSFIKYPSLGSHGVEPPQDVWEAGLGENICNGMTQTGLLKKIRNKKISSVSSDMDALIKARHRDGVDAVIALSNFSTSHTIFRDLMNRKGVRYASMPLFDEEMFYGPMSVDWKAMWKRTYRLAEMMEDGETVSIESPNGTNITMSYKGRKVLTDTGCLTEPGSFGNLPSGEVFLAPVEGSATGILVIDWAPTHKLKSSLILEIKNGMVKEIKGGDPYRNELDLLLKKDMNFRNIAELGIGTNDKAKRPDNILESEKILGTIHIALGDNFSFGGRVRTPFHQDYIVFNPTLKTISSSGQSKVILKTGILKGFY